MELAGVGVVAVSKGEQRMLRVCLGYDCQTTVRPEDLQWYLDRGRQVLLLNADVGEPLSRSSRKWCVRRGP